MNTGTEPVSDDAMAARRYELTDTLQMMLYTRDNSIPVSASSTQSYGQHPNHCTGVVGYGTMKEALQHINDV